MFPVHNTPPKPDVGEPGAFGRARPGYFGRGTAPVGVPERFRLHVETVLIALTVAIAVPFRLALPGWSKADASVIRARRFAVMSGPFKLGAFRLGAFGLSQTAALLGIVTLHAAQRVSLAYPLLPDYPTIGFLAAAALLLFSSPGMPHLSASVPRMADARMAPDAGIAGDGHVLWRIGRMRRRAASKEAAEETYDAAAADGGLGQRYGGSQPAERYLSDWEVVQKSTFDLTLATLLLPLLCPLMLLIAAAIWFESRGPILFRQPRAGLDGRTFTIYKFRTMYHHLADIGADRQTSRGDPRVTKLGRVLRRYSLDELPQLLNVFRGDMSLVGPRPHAPQTTAAGVPFAQAVQEYCIRHSVKPGITGWAQVNGARGEVATIHQLRKRVAYDLFYIMNWSVFFDIKIIVLTIRREVFSQHAF